MLQTDIIDDDLFIVCRKEYNQNNSKVIRLKSGIEFEFVNNELASIFFPNLLQRLGGRHNINEIQVENIIIDDNNTTHVTLNIDGNFANLKFDCNELKNQNI